MGCRAGSVTTERRRFPAPGKTGVVHIDVDPAVIGANYAADVGLVGDCRIVLRQLINALAGQTTFDLPSRLNPAAIAKAKMERRMVTVFFICFIICKALYESAKNFSGFFNSISVITAIIWNWKCIAK